MRDKRSETENRCEVRMREREGKKNRTRKRDKYVERYMRDKHKIVDKVK